MALAGEPGSIEAGLVGGLVDVGALVLRRHKRLSRLSTAPTPQAASTAEKAVVVTSSVRIFNQMQPEAGGK